MGRKIGIDLGTTNSVIAVIDPRARVLENREGSSMTSSVVSHKTRRGATSGEIVVGDVAMDNLELAPKDTIISIKRLMGRASTDLEVEKVRNKFQYEVAQLASGTKDSICVKIGGKEYTPVEVSAMILKKLKEDAEFRLGEAVTHAVVTVPAYFSQIQRDATRQAAKLAGLQSKILDEPTAAAIAFGMDALDTSEPKYLLVYDLGGGTFDISIMTAQNGAFAQMNLAGDMWLGGDDFDQKIIDHVLDYVQKEYGIEPNAEDKRGRRFLVALRKAARATKERLSSSNSSELIVQGLLQDDDENLIDVVVEITRAQYEKMITPLVMKSVDLVRKALEDASLKPQDIDYVLMAGNSTNLPLVQKTITDMFGAEKVQRKIHAKHCVAMGAAIMAARIPDDDADASSAPIEGPSVEIHKIAPFHYGIRTDRDRFNLFIHKGDIFPTPIDKRVAQTFLTGMANQRIVSISVLGGEDTEKASANESQGNVFLFLPPGMPKDTRILVKIWLNDDGIFELAAQLENGTQLSPVCMQGGEDKKAAETIEYMEKTLAAKLPTMTPAQRALVENERNNALKKIQEKDYQGAQRAAEECEAKVAAQASGQNILSEKEAANRLCNYAEIVLDQYSWALNAGQEDRLTKQVKELRVLAKSESSQLGLKTSELDKMLDNIPEEVLTFMRIRFEIGSRIRPTDPSEASMLMRELQEVEKAFRAQSAHAVPSLEALVGKIVATAEKLASKGSGAVVCTSCQTPLNGERYCPSCGEDAWALKSIGKNSGKSFDQL